MITLDDKYIIANASNCYVAKFLTGGKPKKDKDTGEILPANRRIGYYGNLTSAIKACKDDAVSQKLAQSNYTLAEALETIGGINRHFEEVLQSVCKDQ